MKFKTLFQRRPTATMAESDTMTAATTTKRKKKETKTLTTTMKTAAGAKNAFITIARQDKCASCSSASSKMTETQANNVAVHHRQPQPDESADSIRFSCENCGGRDINQRISGVSDDNAVTMHLTENLPQKDANMDLEEAKQKIEEEYKGLLMKAHTKIKELTDEVERMKIQNADKEKEFVELHKDFLLCMRSAERFRFEAEREASRLKFENFQLRQGQGLRTEIIAIGSRESSPCDASTTADPLLPAASLTDQIATDCEAVEVKNQVQGGLVLSDDVLYPERVENIMKQHTSKRDEKLAILRKNCRGSLRNGLLNWCQAQTKDYKNVEITNFSTSWTNGLALAALVHSFKPDEFDYDALDACRSVNNFETALKAAEKLGVNSHLNAIKLMVESEHPPWEPIVAYVTEIYLAVSD